MKFDKRLVDEALSLSVSRFFCCLTAVLGAGTLLLVPAPARAEHEMLSLAMPRDADIDRAETGIDLDAPLPPPHEPADSLPALAQVDRPPVAVHLARRDTHETFTAVLPRDGQLGAAEVEAVAHFFRCRRTGQQRPISPGVLAMLADVAAHWPDREIEIVSGFRARPFGAPHSKHFKGQAIDLRIAGVRSGALRDYVWREHHSVGVGYYQKENFVHMDSRPGEQDCAWTGTEEGGFEDYNPRWARKARRGLPVRRSAPEPLPESVALVPVAGASGTM